MENSIEGVLSSVMGNEELMNKIREAVKGSGEDTASSLGDVISLITPVLNEDKNSSKNFESTTTTDSSEVSIKGSELGSFLSSFSHTIEKNTGLLIALKPYLSKERCQMIDSVVKISRLSEALKLL